MTEPIIQSEMKTVSILFTTYTDFVSRLVGIMSGFNCTHVSIALDEENEYFYSFNTKGFKKEYPKKHKNRTKENICLRIQVTQQQYNKLCSLIKKFERKKSKYKYNFWGVICCMFRLPHERKDKYFCSEFVAELLDKAKIIKLKKPKSKYLPYHLKKELLLCPLLISVAQNIFII